MIFSINVSQNNTHLLSVNYNNALSIFGIKTVPDKNALAKLYKSLAKKAHPDAGGSNKSFNDLVNAYKVLQNPRPPEMLQKPVKKPENKNYNFNENYEFEKFKIHQNFEITQWVVFWFMVLILRYKITHFNNEKFLKTNKGKFIYIANKKINKNNLYFKLNKKFIKVTKNEEKFIKINDLIFILFI